jgi:hypothetical protein
MEQQKSESLPLQLLVGNTSQTIISQTEAELLIAESLQTLRIEEKLRSFGLL